MNDPTITSGAPAAVPADVTRTLADEARTVLDLLGVAWQIRDFDFTFIIRARDHDGVAYRWQATSPALPVTGDVLPAGDPAALAPVAGDRR